MSMQYRKLGASNLRVSALCLGTMMFGDQTDATEASAIVADAQDKGVNFIDTADVYAKGESERVLGKVLKPRRDDWIVATKLGNKMSNRVNEGHYSRKWVMYEAEQSLRRMDTEYVDILYLHRDMPETNLEEALRALDVLIRDGKVRYWGVSNFLGWRIAEAVRIARDLGMPAPVVCQPHYNLLNRTPEVEILPACMHHGLGIVPYSPIARGILTGKYLPGQSPEPGSRAARGDTRMAQSEFRPESLEVAQRLQAYVQDRGVSLAQFATAWVLAHRGVSSVIAGPRTLAQWQGYGLAVTYKLTTDDEALVNSLVAPGHPSTPGFTDLAYPLPARW
jgi:aryl-alcohol dehydrogenase-like predicted oxidoreductase